MRERNINIDRNAPKPVHPRPVRYHGLLSTTYVRQHWMHDPNWSPSSLTEEFKSIADLLASRLVFKKLDAKDQRQNAIRENRRLKRQCRDGRSKLQMIMYGDNTKEIRSYLINHKDMQRLYQKMPLELVINNINQRTFVMRKERDRLRYRLENLKREYNQKLLDRAQIENRIKYENEYALQEDIKSREFMKKIENSGIRLRAIKTINSTFKKMLQVLQQDSIFYEPILRSLTMDIEDQSNFIKHVLYLGMPAISKFRVLSEEYRLLEDKTRKLYQEKQQWIINFKNSFPSPTEVNGEAERGTIADQIDQANRYVRETQSMTELRRMCEEIEDVINQVQNVTVCSQAREIFQRIKMQIENNLKLFKETQNDELVHESLGSKMKRAKLLQGILYHNLAEEEIKRLKYIEKLNTSIKEADSFEATTLAYMKNRADTFVLLRFTLWNLLDITKHVGATPKPPDYKYASSYLNLPLLKFEMLNMRTWPPEPFLEKLDTLMQLIKYRLRMLMKYMKTLDLKKMNMTKVRDEYHGLIADNNTKGFPSGTGIESAPERQSLEMDQKLLLSVPSRKQIKLHSSKLVEELSKKDD